MCLPRQEEKGLTFVQHDALSQVLFTRLAELRHSLHTQGTVVRFLAGCIARNDIAFWPCGAARSISEASATRQVTGEL